VRQAAAFATCKTGNRRTQQVTGTAVVKNRNYSAEGTCGREHRDEQAEDSSRNIQHPMDHSALLVAAPISSVGSNHHNTKSNDLQDKMSTRTPVKSQISQCRLKM
jgi:hypothetical protein